MDKRALSVLRANRHSEAGSAAIALIKSYYEDLKEIMVSSDAEALRCAQGGAQALRTLMRAIERDDFEDSGPA